MKYALRRNFNKTIKHKFMDSVAVLQLQLNRTYYKYDLYLCDGNKNATFWTLQNKHTVGYSNKVYSTSAVYPMLSADKKHPMR